MQGPGAASTQVGSTRMSKKFLSPFVPSWPIDPLIRVQWWRLL